jgi:hypothetical protein
MSKYLLYLSTFEKFPFSYEVHITRLIILIGTITNTPSEKLEGLTKLAKLDFLLRYPAIMKRMLTNKNIKPDLHIKEFENSSIESTMIRYRYGPWDPKYRLYLTILECKGLIQLNAIRKRIDINMTPKGFEIYYKLISKTEFSDYIQRSKIIHKYFSSYSGNTLAKMVYEHIPDLRQMKYGDSILI